MNAPRIPLSPPLIERIPDSDIRPLWSVMIPTYNCITYLKETLESVLLQDEGEENMQIEVIDDCSTDGDVKKIVNEIGKGRILFFCQKQNVGSLRNFETCLNRAKGRLVHLLHGDDQVLPGFYIHLRTLFEQYPSIGAAFTGLSVIDENGRLMYHNNYIQDHSGIINDWLLKIANNQLLRTCAIAIKRDVYEQLGGYYGVHYGEDWEMFVRIAHSFPVAYTPENLALYRIHNDNISSRFLSSGQNIRDTQKVIEIIQHYLPVGKRNEIKKSAKKHFALYFTANAQGIYKRNQNAKIALKQAHGALLLHINKATILSLLKLYIKILINYKSKNKL